MSAKLISHNFTGESIAVVFQNDKGQIKSEFIESSRPQWKAVMALYKEGRYEEMLPLLNLSSCIEAQSHGLFTIVDGKVFYKGNQVESNYLFDRIMFFMRELPKQYPRLVAFAEQLYLNPNPEVRQTLWKFLEHGGNTLTEDGCFLGYKGVDKDGWSKTAGTIKVLKGKTRKAANSSGYQIYNGVGEHIIVERKGVCTDSNNPCADGIHVGSFRYANDFKSDGVMVICKVNPKNVCSVPKDSNFEKLRACEYEVIAEEGRKLDEVRDSNYHRVAAVRYHNRRGSDGKFIPASAPNRDELGRFCS